MARPVQRRRAESDAPDADRYAGRGRRTTEEPEEERRPRRGRGELPPSRGSRDSEPEEPRRGRGRREEPEESSEPTTIEEIDKLSDEDFEALLTKYDIPQMDDPNDEADALLDAIVSAQPDPPRRGRGRSAEEPEDKPRGRGRGRSEPEEEPRGRGRGRGRSSEDDEAPRRTARKGFAGFKKTREETSSFADDFKLTDEEVLVKFLEDEPFAAYAEHGLFQQLNQGQRVWTCLAPEEDCAICDSGHEARAVGLFNVVVMPEDGKPVIKVLKAGPALAKILETKNKLKTGPLSKEYYSMAQSPGKNDGPVVYSVEVVRERDLKEDWKEEPFSDKELDEFRDKMYDETFVQYPSKADVREVAKKLRDKD